MLLYAIDPNEEVELIDHSIADDLVFAGCGYDGPGTPVYPDWSGRYNHGEIKPNFATGPQWEWTPELGRWGVKFDGVDDYALTTCLTTFGAGPFSVACWCKTVSMENDVLITNYDAVNFFFLTIGSASAGVFQFSIRNTSTLNSVGTFNDGVWHHVAATYASGTGRLYVDGKLNNTGALDTGSPDSATVGITLGRLGNVSSLYFTGEMADPLIFSRALSPAEIALLADPSFQMVLNRRERVWAVSRGELSIAAADAFSAGPAVAQSFSAGPAAAEAFSAGAAVAESA